MIFSIIAPALSGCDLFDLGGNKLVDAADAEREAEGLILRDYRTAAVKNSTYEFGGKAFLYFEDKTEVDVTDKCEYPVLDTSVEGTFKYKVSYEGLRAIYSKTIEVNVIDHLELKSIEAYDYSNTIEAKQTYVFDGRVEASYNDGSKKDVTEFCDFSAVDTSKGGVEADLIISYTEDNVFKSIAKKISVTKKVTSIEITASQTMFEINSFNQESVKPVLYVNYSDDTREKVTNFTNFDFSQVDGSVAGEYQITASHEIDGKTFNASLTISIYEHVPVLSKIEASGYSTEVDKGTTYKFDGIVKATFDTGAVVDVTDDCVYGTVSTTSAGSKTLTISYTDPNKSTNKKTISVTIKVISHVTGISVSDSTIEVGVGKTKSITASVTPTDATEKGLTYYSSNTSVATVTLSNSNYVITGVSTGSATITFVSKENSSITKAVTVSVNEVVQDEWIILLYVCGADLESDGGAATDDLKEIASVSGQPDDVNVVVQAGGAKSWKTTYNSVINKDKCNRFHLKDKTYVSDSQTSKVNMGLQSTLQSFIQWGLQTYPADKVGLVLWNHGGAMGGCCYDEQFSDDGLTPAEVAAAVKGAKSAVGYSDKFEFIGYDCCLMQVQDIAGLNSEYANYQIAAEESEWGYGWTYNEWIDDLFAKKSTKTILQAIVDSFKSETSKYYSGTNNDQTLSYLDLSNWSAYETAWESMASTLGNIVTSSSKWNTLANVLNSCQRFGATEVDYWGTIGYPFDVFDVGSFCTKMKASSSYSSNTTLMNKITSVQTAYSDLVVYEWHGAGSSGATGLSLFAPVSGYAYSSDYSTSNTTLSTWRSICVNYGSFQ